jgi:uncharacterized membrane protein YraQ (UPF0718 family)
VKFRGLKLLGIVAALYLGLFLLFPDKGAAALGYGASVLLKILPILAVVVFFTALINYFFDPETLADHLGEKSGMKGWAIALAAGILSHGPMYAWYPMLEDLKSHGMKNGLIAAFFYARSVKIPLLPIMIDYFGLAFTAILTFYILVASVIQGFLIDRLCARCNDTD